MKATAKVLPNHKERGSMLPADGGTVKRYWRGSPTLVSTLISGYELQEKEAKSFVQSWDELMLMSQISPWPRCLPMPPVSSSAGRLITARGKEMEKQTYGYI
jgi:hypothetical protein